MKIKELIKELSIIDGNEEIVSIGTYGGDHTHEFCIHTDKGDYDVGKLVKYKLIWSIGDLVVENYYETKKEAVDQASIQFEVELKRYEKKYGEGTYNMYGVVNEYWEKVVEDNFPDEYMCELYDESLKEIYFEKENGKVVDWRIEEIRI